MPKRVFRGDRGCAGLNRKSSVQSSNVLTEALVIEMLNRGVAEHPNYSRGSSAGPSGSKARRIARQTWRFRRSENGRGRGSRRRSFGSSWIRLPRRYLERAHFKSNRPDETWRADERRCPKRQQEPERRRFEADVRIPAHVEQHLPQPAKVRVASRGHPELRRNAPIFDFRISILAVIMSRCAASLNSSVTNPFSSPALLPALARNSPGNSRTPARSSRLQRVAKTASNRSRKKLSGQGSRLRLSPNAMWLAMALLNAPLQKPLARLANSMWSSPTPDLASPHR